MRSKEIIRLTVIAKEARRMDHRFNNAIWRQRAAVAERWIALELRRNQFLADLAKARTINRANPKPKAPIPIRVKWGQPIPPDILRLAAKLNAPNYRSSAWTGRE